MSRRVLPVLAAGVCLFMGVSASASSAIGAAHRTPTSAHETAKTAQNRPPLPPGGAVDIRAAQGEEFSDLGFGVILASWFGAGALLFLLFSGDDDDPGPPTGTQ